MINILPHHVAATVLLGGLTVGGYYAINSLIPPTLKNHIESLNLELVNNNWVEKARNYKSSENNLIPTIDKSKDNSVLEELLKKWCEKKQEKYFLGNEDSTYRNFSLWCLQNKTIKAVLDGRNLRTLNADGWTKKFENYSSDTNQDKFITQPVKGVAKEHLEGWCNVEKAKNYLYEGEPNLNRILKWCYAT